MIHLMTSLAFFRSRTWYAQAGIGCGWCCAALLGASPAHAQANTEKIFCTDAPRWQWTSEAKAREQFKASQYVLVKYKVSSGNCHEFYAVDAQGTVVESYLHPITGETVRTTRLPAPGAAKH